MARKTPLRTHPLPTATVFVETDDDWYPNYNAAGEGDKHGRLVRLRLTELIAGPWRVSVWGADDCGMYRDFAAEEKADARAVFELLQGGGPVSRLDLEKLGFVPA